MKVIYLDQNAASALAKARNGEPWHAVRELLIAGRQRDLLVCPMPTETLIESAPCKSTTRQAIDALFQRLSGGLVFRSFIQVLRAEILHLVRPAYPVEWCAAFTDHWGYDEVAAGLVAADWTECKRKMSERMSSYRQPAGAEQMTADQIFHSSGLERSGKLFRDIDRFLANPRTPVNDYERPDIMRFLVENGLTIEEAQELRAHIRHHRYEMIPVNFFDQLLGARWDHDFVQRHRERYKPNDEIDRWRAAVALAYADVFITDGGVADLCRRSIPAALSYTSVLSIKHVSAVEKAIKEIVPDLSQEAHEPTAAC